MSGIDKMSAHHRSPPQLSVGLQRTGAGEQAQLMTIDGSTIALSELTQVQLDFGPSRRHVQLDHGEARFTVAKNHLVPFEVAVGVQAIVRAVGTQFSIKKMGPDGARVEVQEGEIDLLLTHRSPRRLKAGESAEFENNLVRLSIWSDSDTVASLQLWLLFAGNPLSKAILEFNHYNSKQKIVADEVVSWRTVKGSFRAADPQGFAAHISNATNLKCSVSRDTATDTDTIRLSLPGARSPPTPTRAPLC